MCEENTHPQTLFRESKEEASGYPDQVRSQAQETTEADNGNSLYKADFHMCVPKTNKPNKQNMFHCCMHCRYKMAYVVFIFRHYYVIINGNKTPPGCN